MIRHYLLISLRNLLRNRSHSLINIAGLTLGLLCATLIFLKLRHETRFDAHRPEADRIYRVMTRNVERGIANSGVPLPFGEAFRTDYPEATTTMLEVMSHPVVQVGRGEGATTYQETSNVVMVEAAYWDIFPPEWLHAPAADQLKAPQMAVISDRLAEKYFGEASPIGEVIEVDQQYTVQIVGLFRDPGLPTELPFSLFITYPTGSDTRAPSFHWGAVMSNVQCYTKLPPALSPAQIEAGGAEFLQKYQPETEDWQEALVLMPLREVHFFPSGDHFGTVAVSRESLWTLGLIGLFLLLTACINFINLNTVLIFRRAREIGLRKVLGSRRGQIVGYFLTETALLSLVSLLLALALAPWATRALLPLLGGEWTFAGTAQGSGFWLYVLLVFGGVVLAAGLYPALLLARIKPVESLKNRIDLRYGQGITLRKGLVILQFGISQALLIVTLVMMSQMDYFRTRPLGFDREAILHVHLPEDTTGRQHLALKQAWLRHPDVASVSLSNSGTASGSIWKSSFAFFPTDTSTHPIEDFAQVKMVDPDYLSTYGLHLLAGENLLPTDSASHYLINTSMLALLGVRSPEAALGLSLECWGHRLPIRGVVQDFHTTSLHQPIEPVIIWVAPGQYYMAGVKLQRIHPEVLAHLESTWTQRYPGRAYNARFLDETIAHFYAEEDRAYQLFRLFAGLAIVIGCMGLFGLVSFMAASRSKEVGIRKVLGASVAQLVGLFTREFLWLVLIGFALAAPAAWYLTQEWLAGFAYRISLGPGFFVAALLLSLVLVALTVGYKAYRSAATNPVEALRNE